MKNILLIIALLSSVVLNAQIQIGSKTPNEDPKKEETGTPDKKDDVIKISKKKRSSGALGQGNISVYLGYAPTFSYRSLIENPTLFGEELGLRVNEKAAWVHSGSLGVRANLHKYLMLDASFGYMEDGESYSFNSPTTDSTYNYKNSYRNFSVSIKLYAKYDLKKFSFYAGGGITPALFINQAEQINYNDGNGNPREVKNTYREGYNAFNLHLVGSVGVSYHFHEYASFYLMPEYRYGLFSTYQKQSAYVRKPFSLALHFGFSLDF
jgi:hypothetical protein